MNTTGTKRTTAALVKRAVARALLGTVSELSPIAITQQLQEQQLTSGRRPVLVTDVAIACDLLVLQDLATKSSAGYRASALLKQKVLVTQISRGFRRRQHLAPLKSTALMTGAASLVTGCSMLMMSHGTESPPTNTAQPESAPGRIALSIAQFVVDGQPVFRYCTDDCPTRTPKILAGPGASLASITPDTPNTSIAPAPFASLNKANRTASGGPAADIPPPTVGSAPPVSMTTPNATEPIIQSARLTETARSVEPPSGRVDTTTRTSNVPAKGETPSLREQVVATAAAPLEPSLRLDRTFKSYDSLIYFADGSQTVGPRGRAAIEKLLPAARLASMVVLKGHVARSILTDTDRTLAIGRSIAVKTALVAEGVERAKIKILVPTNNSLLDTNSSASANRSVEVRLTDASAKVAEADITEELETNL